MTGAVNVLTPACLTRLDAIETESPQCQPEAPGLRMQKQTVVFRSQGGLKSQMQASVKKPH